MEENYDVLLSYDVNSKHDAVHSAIKNCMIEKGYADRFTYNGKIFYLPNTTLWRPNITSNEAYTDLDTCIKEFNKKTNTSHKLERFIATKFIKWITIPGEPHTSNSKAPNKG